jgi:PhoPQ-activated pathogenicity-related protein
MIGPLTRADFLVGTLSTAALGALPKVPLLGNGQTALDRYIAAADPSYGYRLLKVVEGKGYRAYVLEMTSQRWRSSSEVDEPIWTHELTIVEPMDVKTSVATLVIGGGSNTEVPTARISPLLVTLALDTNAIASGLQQIPNQPLKFVDQPDGLIEDDLIAYTWAKFLRTGDETWPLRLPMTKAVVRAMDTITSLCALQGTPVDRFIVGGASKRGWTTWTTAAADKRVVGFVPVVADVPNMIVNMQHEYEVYGRWPPSLDSYVKFGIVNWLGTSQLRALAEIEDPISYLPRYTMPKLLLNASGDEFFVPDSSQFYYGNLPPKKYLRYIANTGHSLSGAGGSIADTALAFCHSIMYGMPLPTLTWELQGSDTIVARSTGTPRTARMWEAIDPKARDFRIETIGKAFNYHDLKDQGGNTYVARVGAPAHRWRAFFAELTYATPSGRPFTMTTEVRVI